MLLIFLVAITAILILWVFRSSKKFVRIFPWSSAWKNVPPGPPRLPLIGNSLQLGKVLHEGLYNMGLKYGDLFMLDICGQGMLVVSDAKLVKEILSEVPASGRIDSRHFFDVNSADGIKHGIIIGEGDHWEELRRFTIRHLRDFGFGRKTMEESTMTEVSDFIARIKAHGKKPISDIKERLMIAVVNSLWSIVAGQRNSHDDEKTIEFISSIERNLAYLQNECSPLVIVSAWFAKTFSNWNGYGKFRTQFDKLAQTYFLKTVEDHRATLEANFNRDFVDIFLREIEKNGHNQNSAFNKNVGFKHLNQCLFDLYIAGTDTTSNTLAFGILYLSKHPEVQAKLHDEISVITGNSRPCRLTDRPFMPFTEAVLAETMRMSSILAQSVMHRTMSDMEFKGYTIPNDTVIIPNLYFIHHDPKVWRDPWEFQPERFLSADGKSFKKHEALMPFSVGRRQCLGESLARDNLFLFLTNTFQSFDVEFDKDGPENDMRATIGVTLTPKPFNVIFNERI